MTKLFSSQNLTEVELLSSILEEHGIAVTVKNRYLAMTRGEVPFTDTWPEIWLLRDADLPQAQAVLDAGRSQTSEEAQDWTCPGCGENIEGQFSTCWNCGTDRPVDATLSSRRDHDGQADQTTRTQMMAIRIIEVPPGEAPPEVRAAWVGLVLPLAVSGKRNWKGVGVLTGPRNVFGLLLHAALRRLRVQPGYSVDVLTAVAILERTAPTAAEWWRQNAAHMMAPGRRFIFAAHACEETTPPVWPPPPERRS